MYNYIFIVPRHGRVVGWNPDGDYAWGDAGLEGGQLAAVHPGPARAGR